MTIRPLMKSTIQMLVCTLGLPFLLFSQDYVPLIKRVKESVVVITTYDLQGNPVAQGSGFFLNSDGDVITNYHVIDGSSFIEVLSPSNEVYKVKKVIAYDIDSDLAKISVDIAADKVKPLALSNTLPEVGEKVLVIGSPRGLEQTVTEGIVSAVRSYDSARNVIQISAPISPGSSGSPVLDMRGRVIGVATFTKLDGQNLNFAMPSNLVTDMKTSSDRKDFISSDGASLNFLEGRKRTWIEDWEEALTYFEKATQLNPNYFEAWDWIGKCKNQRMDYAGAAAAYKAALRINSDDYCAWAGLCLAMGGLGKWSDAESLCKTAVSLNEKSSVAWSNLGHLYIMKDDVEPEKALHYCEKAVALESHNTKARICLAFALVGVGRNAESELTLLKLIEYEPENVEAILLLGVMYNNTGKKELAMAQYRKLQKLDKAQAKELFEQIFPPK